MTDQNDARYFFEIGYLARLADEVTGRAADDAAIDHAWEIAPQCADYPAEFDRHLNSAATARGEAVEECARVADNCPAEARKPAVTDCFGLVESVNAATLATGIASAVRSLAPARDEGGL